MGNVPSAFFLEGAGVLSTLSVFSAPPSLLYVSSDDMAPSSWDLSSKSRLSCLLFLCLTLSDAIAFWCLRNLDVF